MNTRMDPADDDLEQLLGRSRRLEDAPEAVIGRAIGIWSRSPRAAAGLLHRVLAALTFDSGDAAIDPRSLGLRSSSSPTRQMLYSAEGRDIDLRLCAVGPADRGVVWRLSGQILGPDAVGHAVLRFAGGERLTDWNEVSEFSFDEVPEGRVEVILRSMTWEIALPPIDIPAPRQVPTR
jgi:hypothetical protein